MVKTMWHPGWGSRDWQADFAFRTARAAWEATGDLDDVAAALQFVLSPTLLKITETSVPSTRDDFFRECSATLPGVTIEEGDLLGFGIFAASWRAEKEY
jgi:hypothetical protein